ncbi:Mu transposase C-terminal domain-containing protein [Halalkalibacter akibai]|uniref:Tn7-like transposition protein B n=1 Tax=Halalkalibacter akibai (strain ATCC 43226 / DSM 21942 / CIP 109018 / JCM 9157 / 1139) TaxID=1236973 RepID=W4QY23_HALA3|nr:Mu transposase C-terminal domain-containing protein [Halalkalibacter akibai]GAE36817.1 Tn7-like transposition protein B [Halalkalibacter akibai JCM 9157]
MVFQVIVNTILVTELPDEKLIRQRVLWIDSEGFDCFVIDIDDPKALPVYKQIPSILKSLEEHELFIETVDPFLKFNLEETIPEKQRKMRDERWNHIESIVSVDNEPDIYIKESRWVLIQSIEKLHPMTVYKYLRHYWQRGKVLNALLPDYGNSGVKERKYGDAKTGRPRKYSDNQGINVTVGVKKKFEAALEKYYFIQGNSTLTYTYKQLIKEHFSNVYYENGIKVLVPQQLIPSYRQLLYYANKNYSTSAYRKKRIGEKKYNLTERPILGSSTTDVNGPGSVYQIDATRSNVYLVSRLKQGQTIGRATVYYLIDVASREVAGLYIGLEEPSWVGAMMAISNAASNKVEYCRELGITITPDMWLAEHMPRRILCDKGTEFTSDKIEQFANVFKVRVDNAPTGRADLKGIVEQYIYRAEEKVKSLLPGYVHKDANERGAPDYRKDAVLTIEDYTKIIVKGILQFNQHHWIDNYPRTKEMLEDNVNPIPNELWRWGISKQQGVLRKFPQEYVKYNLLPSEDASVTVKGIKFKEMYYYCKYADSQDWFYQANGGSWNVKVSYDPRLTTYIYLQVDNQFEVCELLEKDKLYRDMSFREVKMKMESEKKDKVNQESVILQSDINLILEVEEVVKKAMKRRGDTKVTGVTTKQILPHRLAEKDVERKEQAFVLVGKEEEKQYDSGIQNDELYEKGELVEEDDIALLMKIQKGRIG